MNNWKPPKPTINHGGYEPEEFDRIYRIMYRRINRDLAGGAQFGIDIRMASPGWKQAFRRIAIPMYALGMIEWCRFKAMGGEAYHV